MLRVDYSDEAMWDLARIWASIAQRGGIGAADRFRGKIEEKLARIIAKHPGAGRLRPEFRVDIRSVPIPPYVMFYRLTGRSVRVIRIRHGHGDFNEPLMSLLAAV